MHEAPIEEEGLAEQFSDDAALNVAETKDFLEAADEALTRNAPILLSSAAFGPSTGRGSVIRWMAQMNMQRACTASLQLLLMLCQASHTGDSLLGHCKLSP
jgi:hypothetical protein